MLSPDQILNIATYNVHRGVGIDRRYRPERIATVIRELDADILGLQEVTWSHVGEDGPAQFEYFAEETGLTSVIGPNIRDHRGHYGNVLLTRLPVLSVRCLDLTVAGYEPRGAIDVDLDAGHTRLRVVVTHLGLRRRERRRQVRMLMDGLAHADGTSLTFLGDFNEWLPRGNSLRPIITVCGDSRAPRTYPSWRPMFALDRIWARPGTALSGVQVHATRTARRASDHLPLRATLNRSTLLPK